MVWSALRATTTACFLAFFVTVSGWAQTKPIGGPGYSVEEIEEVAVAASREGKDRFQSEIDISIIGHTRQRMTYLDDFSFGQERPTGDLFYTHRYFLGAELKGRLVRGIVELSAAFDHGSQDPNSPVEENQLAVQRAWVEADLFDNGETTLALRVGRDEWRLGSQRLVGWRDGTNVRRRFDGARLFAHHGDWDLQLLLGFEVENDPGFLDDDIIDNRSLWGVYGVGPAPFGLPGRVDLYYLGFDDDFSRNIEVRGNERRHSVGARWWGKAEGWDWNTEFIYQFGTFDTAHGEGDIRAWTVATITGYSFNDLPLQPRLAISANVATGDRNPDDNDLTSFNALFPRGSYFSEVAQFGPRNFYNFNPYLTLNLAPGLAFITDVNFFWRYSIFDGMYGPPGFLVRAPMGSTSRFVNRAVSFNTEYQITPNLFAGLIYTRSKPGAFIKDTDPNANAIDFVEFTVRYDL